MQKIETLKKRISQNLDKLEAFLAVAQKGSISRAAPVAHLSPSALSHLVSNLEDSLGAKLFLRKSHGLELTEEGRALKEFARGLSLEIDDFATRFAQPDQKLQHLLKIGTHETLAAHIWPQLILELSRSAKNIQIALQSGRVDSLVNALLDRELHYALTVRPHDHARLEIRPVYDGELKFFIGAQVKSILPIGKRGSRTPSIRISDLKGVSILTDSGSHVRQGVSISQALRDAGISDFGTFEVGSYEAAMNLAEKGLGIAVVPDRNARRAVQESRLRELPVSGLRSNEALKYQICLSARKVRRESELDQVLYAKLLESL